MKRPSIKLVPQLDCSPHWVTFAQTIPGKLFLVAAFSGLLFLHSIAYWWLISLYLLAFSLWPQYRWQVLFVSTWSFLPFAPTGFNWERINQLFSAAEINWQIHSTLEGLPIILAVIMIAALCVGLVTRYPSSRLGKRPILGLVSAYLFLVVAASYIPMPAAFNAVLWAVLVVFGQYFWFVCYSLKESRSINPVPLPYQLGRYLPFWKPGNIPYPKGAAYLKKIEAKSPREFAVCQLKGLKLILWAFWLKIFSVAANVALYGYDDLFFGHLQIKRQLSAIQLYFDGSPLFHSLHVPFTGLLPRYDTATKLAVAGTPYPWHLNWAITIAEFFFLMLYLAFVSHIAIAVIRMCGFNALRNTYRPLSSRTIAEFWNRYFYYFKELLVEFFFYPTFLRYFKNRPVLRMYAATMSAAFFGNFLFHYMQDIWFIIEMGAFQALVAFHSYFVYTFILGNAIFLSQWWQAKKQKHEPTLPWRIFASIRVLGFYCLLSVLVDFRRESIFENITFLRALLPF